MDRIHPRLKALGFRKQRHTFSRETEPGFVHVVNFQMGPYEPGPDYEFPPYKVNLYGHFTVNLGVFISEVHEITSPGVQPKHPKEYECEIRARLGNLMPGERDQWWSLEPEPDGLVPELWEAVETYGLPFFDRFGSRVALLSEWYRDESALTRWCARGGLAIALMHAWMGDKDLGEQVLAGYYRTAMKKHPRHVSFIREVAERAGLALPAAT